MGYRIEYDSIGKFPVKRGRNWTGLLVGLIILLLVFGSVAVKTTGLEWVQEVLLPGDPAVTASALEGMVEDLRSGESVGYAVKAFCDEIMKHAENVE